MLIFIILLLAIAIWGIFMRRRNNKPVPAIEEPKPFLKNQFKEEFAMEEKETKIIKERVKTAENAKIERVAAAKVEEEIGEELAPLKNQLRTIQDTLSQLNSVNQHQSTMSTGWQNEQQSNDLLSQMQDFSSQAQQQQQKTFQQLQQSVHQAAQILSNVEQSIQSINMLNQITQQINQSQQQLQQQYQGQQQSQQQSQGHAGHMLQYSNLPVKSLKA
jgi:DNA repair exonuclease SbcCD ATPase subunit